MRAELSETLVFLQALSERAGVMPILFGIAVLEVLGIGDFSAADLDVIVRAKEASALAAAVGIEPGGEGGNERFRSMVHLHLGGAPLIIDVMAGMTVHTADGWVPYEVEKTVEIEACGKRFHAASLADLRRFYGLADRAKDMVKIAALDATFA